MPIPVFTKLMSLSIWTAVSTVIIVIIIGIVAGIVGRLRLDGMLLGNGRALGRRLYRWRYILHRRSHILRRLRRGCCRLLRPLYKTTLLKSLIDSRVSILILLWLLLMLRELVLRKGMRRPATGVIRLIRLGLLGRLWLMPLIWRHGVTGVDLRTVLPGR